MSGKCVVFSVLWLCSLVLLGFVLRGGGLKMQEVWGKEGERGF